MSIFSSSLSSPLSDKQILIHMIRKMIFALVGLMSAGSAVALGNDSVKAYELKEVVAEARYNTVDAKVLRFTPSSRQKSASMNGIDLLRRMSIPQIKVSLTDDKVTTATGEPVSVFINYIAASSEELEGLRTGDVRRVEYYYSPTDQRFMGKRNVVNIIVQAYEYGGYTKLSTYQRFMIGLHSNASVYSKFTYRKMTYDIYVGSVNRNNKHTGSSFFSDFTTPRDNGETKEIRRFQKYRGSGFESNSIRFLSERFIPKKLSGKKHNRFLLSGHSAR